MYTVFTTIVRYKYPRLLYYPSMSFVLKNKNTRHDIMMSSTRKRIIIDDDDNNQRYCFVDSDLRKQNNSDNNHSYLSAYVSGKMRSSLKQVKGFKVI